MKTVDYFWLICCLTLLGISGVRGKDLATYKVGDVAEENIIAPVALDVIDPAATAALKAAEAMRTPAIFRICSDATNALAGEFLAAFTGARSNFLAAMQDSFHAATLDEKAIALPDFGYFVTAFNVKNKNFPVSPDLAATWARGNSDLAAQNRLLDLLLLTMQHPVRADDLPGNFSTGETVRLVPVSAADEKLSFADTIARGQLLTESSLTTLSQLQIIFRREFTADEQPLAHALAMLLKPDCLPDAGLTQLARERAVSRLVVAEHYDAGQLIVRQGAVIDAKTKTALEQLNEPLAALLPSPTAAARETVLREPSPASPVVNPAPTIAPKKPEPTVAAQNPLLKIFAPGNRLIWPAIAFAAISIPGLLVAGRLFFRRRLSLLPVRAVNLPAQNPSMLPAELAPHLVQVVKEALVQELAVQRRELLVAQQIATAEITGLVRRLDELQMTMQERVQTYEMQIQRLERELAARTEENQELLKLKVEMLRQQLEVERARTRMEFN